MGSLWKGERSNLGVGWVLGQIFFDEFSTALIFFLILKKAFCFFVFLSKKGDNEKTTLCLFGLLPAKVTEWLTLVLTLIHIFHSLIIIMQNFFYQRKEPTFMCILSFTFFSFFHVLGREGVFLFIYVLWLGGQAGGPGNKIWQKKVVFSCSGFLL